MSVDKLIVEDVPDATLLNTAKACIAAGTLPPHAPRTGFSETSSGVPCSLCQQGIASDAFEIKIYRRDSRYPCCFHPECFAAWRAATVRPPRRQTGQGRMIFQLRR
jgi:hypothetical protein